MKTNLVLNIGCGATRIPGSIGVDRVFIENCVDVMHDLDVLPYPFESSSVSEIHCYHVLEHLSDPLKILEEFHRMLREDGILYLRVPHFSSNGAFTDITHKRPFSYFTFDIFSGEDEHSFYTKCRFNILQRSIKYFGRYPNEGLYEKYIAPNRCPIWMRPFVRLINVMINASPMAFERFWCYWVGGACEVVIELKKSS